MTTIGRFTVNKQRVRDLQAETIRKRLKDRLGSIRYFGLPSDEMKDIIDWKPLFSEFITVERGTAPDNWARQHALLLNAFRNNVLSKLRLMRGDIDRVILEGKDGCGNVLEYPFDVITLDYSGGLLYRNEKGVHHRLAAVRKLIEAQAEFKLDYLLFISSNLDNCKDAEIQKTLANIKTELIRYGANGEAVISAYLGHPDDEVRLKVYMPYFVNQIAAKVNYNCETEDVIFYLGNLDTHMVNFRFWLKYDPRTTAPRLPRERIVQIINSPMIEIREGECINTTLNLPKLKTQVGNEG